MCTRSVSNCVASGAIDSRMNPNSMKPRSLYTEVVLGSYARGVATMAASNAARP
jgi:hypothetical protein